MNKLEQGQKVTEMFSSTEHVLCERLREVGFVQLQEKKASEAPKGSLLKPVLPRRQSSVFKNGA